MVCEYTFVFMPQSYPSSVKADDNLLPLVIELNTVLGVALQSLGGKSTEGEASYLVWAASHVSRLVAGYIELRKCGLTYASKLLVRPVLESAVDAVAAVKRPEFILYKASKEHHDASKLLLEIRAIFESRNQPTSEIDKNIADMESQWRRFEHDWIKRRPNDAKRPKKMDFKRTLELIGLGDWYSSLQAGGFGVRDADSGL